MATEPEDKFIPQSKPLTLEEMADYVEDGGVVIRRSDVDKAIATADDELKQYLQAAQYKSKK